MFIGFLISVIINYAARGHRGTIERAHNDHMLATFWTVIGVTVAGAGLLILPWISGSGIGVKEQMVTEQRLARDSMAG